MHGESVQYYSLSCYTDKGYNRSTYMSIYIYSLHGSLKKWHRKKRHKEKMAQEKMAQSA